MSGLESKIYVSSVQVNCMLVTWVQGNTSLLKHTLLSTDRSYWQLHKYLLSIHFTNRICNKTCVHIRNLLVLETKSYVMYQGPKVSNLVV